MAATYEKSTETGSRFPRRALLTAATAAGLCAAGAIAAPRVVPYVEGRVEQVALGELEGVSIDAAIEAAGITRAAVQVIVIPVATLVADLGGGALGLVLGALNTAHNALAFIRASTATVDQLRDVITSWQAGVNAMPIALNAYTTADITSAETYLRALKKQMQQAQQSQQ
jgi:hypothetical protein